MPCTRHHSQYVYNASTYAISADFERPKKHSLPPQAASVLSAHGGHGTNRSSAQKVDGLVSFENAYSEVGGSFDDCHDTYTTHAWSVLEYVNVADMLTADRIVSRLAIYHPADGKTETSFDITGSYFDNLRIAGHKVEVRLDTQLHHDYNTYSTLAQGHQQGTTDPMLLGSGFIGLSDEEMNKIQDKYHALKGMSTLVNAWKGDKSNRPADCGVYRLSVANQTKLDYPSEVKAFGSIICIPKFGVIRLGEMVVHKHSRSLVMFMVQMCSSGHGTTTGGGTSGTGGVGSP
ncbi:MAG TPA: hypothetical protein VFW31_13320 [Candidatus Angelobacter sp.]|nr:hypothetical protein [Candidatus Angelobacter sp.]